MIGPDVFDALKPVVRAFQRLGVTYFIGGSIASTSYGIARATIDIDLVADLKAEHIEPLVEELQAAYYIDAAAVEDAVSRRSSFNLIHLETIIKIDVFIPKSDPFDLMTFGRARERLLASDRGGDLFTVASPEDVVLRKLDWYRTGGEVSERQWGDVIGVLKVQAEALDRAYLAEWAVRLGVSDLLERALADAGLSR